MQLEALKRLYHQLTPLLMAFIRAFGFGVGLEWKLSELGAVKTSMKKDPSAKKEIRDVLTVSLQGTAAGYRDPDDSDEDD